MTKEITDLMGNIIRVQSTLDTKQKKYDDILAEIGVLETELIDLTASVSAKVEDLSKLLQDSGKLLG